MTTASYVLAFAISGDTNGETLKAAVYSWRAMGDVSTMAKTFDMSLVQPMPFVDPLKHIPKS